MTVNRSVAVRGLAACCLVNLCIGSLYAWSVFASPLAELLDVEASSLSIAFTLANGIGPVTMISGGFVVDRMGAKNVIIAAGVLFGIGMLATGMATSTAWILISYGLGVGLAVGMAYGAVVSTAVRFLPDKPGLAGGIATASYGISSVLVPPVANALMQAFGVAFTLRALGSAMALVITASAIAMPAPAISATSKTTEGLDWKGMLASRDFYVMFTLLLCGAFSGLMMTSQASQLAQNIMGLDAASAALVVSLLALFNTGGRIAAGQASDRFGLVPTLRIVYMALAASMSVLTATAFAPVLLIPGICLTGFCFGCIMGAYPSFTASRFGLAHNTVNYGIMFIGFALAGLLGPQAMNALHAATGGYTAAFVVALALSVAGFFLANACGAACPSRRLPNQR